MLDDDWWSARRKAAEMLHRASIEPAPPIDGIRPEVWQIAGPIYTIAKTLQEHGFIETRVLNPAGWRFKPGGLPPAVRAAYRKALREYRTSGTIWFEGMFERFAYQVGED